MTLNIFDSSILDANWRYSVWMRQNNYKMANSVLSKNSHLNSDDFQFEKGDLVWAAVDGYRFWPALIIDLDKKIESNGKR